MLPVPSRGLGWAAPVLRWFLSVITEAQALGVCVPLQEAQAGLISVSEMPGRHSPLGLLIYYASSGQAPGRQLAEHRMAERAAAS